MKFYCLSFTWKKKAYKLSEYSGNLYSSDFPSQIHSSIIYPEKLIEAIGICNNPYLSGSYSGKEYSENYNHHKIANKAKLLVSLCRLNFWVAKQYANFQSCVFCDVSESIAFFRSITSKEKSDSLCLPQSLFAAKTSKLFDQKGVLFIGAFLPARAMHAWIIEDGIQPDPLDNIWHQYRPIAAIC
jgi:hypothetical protein